MIAQKMTPISRRHALLCGGKRQLNLLPRLSFATEEMVAGRISEVTGGKAAGDLEIYGICRIYGKWKSGVAFSH